MKVVLSAEKRAELLEKFGGDNERVNKLLNFADVVSKGMEDAGLDLKSLEAVDDILNDPGETAAEQEVKDLGEATLIGFKAVAEQIKEIASGIKTSQDEQAKQISAAAQAVTDLKAFVEKEFGYSPRASKSDKTKLSPNNPQVAHLKKENAAAGKKSEDDVTPGSGPVSNPSILDAMLQAVKNGNK